MTREQIERDIETLRELRLAYDVMSDEQARALDRVINGMLQRLHGPPPGHCRITLEIERGRGQALKGALIFAGDDIPKIDEHIYVVADIPMRVSRTVEGVVS